MTDNAHTPLGWDEVRAVAKALDPVCRELLGKSVLDTSQADLAVLGERIAADRAGVIAQLDQAVTRLQALVGRGPAAGIVDAIDEHLNVDGGES